MTEFIKKFEIENFRSFCDKQELILGIPDEKKAGSGLTIIVGPNNAGKTSLVESLLKDSTKTIYDEDRVNDKEPSFIFYKEDNTEFNKVNTVQAGSSQLSSQRANNFQVVPSRRDWSNRASNPSSEEVTSSRHDVRAGGGINVANSLADIETKPARLKIFNELLKQIFSNFSKWTISESRNIGKYIAYTTKSGKKHFFDIIGQGISSVFRILLHLTTDQVNQLLIIDEPELSLQPEAQRRLFKIIADSAKKRQIILSTHSPYFVDMAYFENGATIARINKPNDQNSVIKNLKTYSSYKGLLGGANWQQPFLIDEVAKDIFFNDYILFVEGQENVGLIKKYYKEILQKDIPFNIFGYGVRGKDNFKFACELAKDLGLEKVCVLIDGSTETESIFKDLKTDYEDRAPKYKIIRHDKGDIRNKKCNCCVTIDCKNNRSGYFDEDGNIILSEKDNLKKIISDIETYFSNNTTP